MVRKRTIMVRKRTNMVRKRTNMVRKRNINGSDCSHRHQSWKQSQKYQKQLILKNKPPCGDISTTVDGGHAPGDPLRGG